MKVDFKKVAVNTERLIQVGSLFVTSSFSIYALWKLTLHPVIEYAILGANVVVGLRAGWEYLRHMSGRE